MLTSGAVLPDIDYVEMQLKEKGSNGDLSNILQMQQWHHNMDY